MKTSSGTKLSRGGFSLIELIVAMFVFAILALALTKSLIFTKYMAEDNLYDATALTVASSLIEQIKGTSFANLASPAQTGGADSIEMIGGGGVSKMLVLDDFNDLEVPLVTEAGGTTAKTMPMRVRPSLEEMEEGDGFWITVEFEYDHPRTGRTRSQTLRNARSAVPMN